MNVKYYSEETGHQHSMSGVIYLDEAKNYKESTLQVLGDGNVCDGENIEVNVCAWADSYALSDIGEYNADSSFAVDVVFST